MDKQIDKLIDHIRDLENRLGEVDNNLRYIKVVQALKHSLDKLDDMLRNNIKLQREYQAIYHRYFYTGCGFSFMIESVILYWIINMETNLFKIDIMNIDYKVGEVKLSYKPKFKNQQKVTCSEDAYKYMLSTYKKETICYKEYFKVLFLNQANQVLGYTLISEGGLTETTADVRLIFQAALLTNSVALILAHNHPSGNLKPSPEDIRLTKQVREASNFMRIKILDHIILSDTEYYSFADEGML